MHFAAKTLALLAAAQAAVASPIHSRSPYAIKETHFVPAKWTRVGAPSPDTIVDLKIAFTNKRFHELEKHLYEVSDPEHARYGQHLSTEHIDSLTRPDQEASELVDEWLDDFGIGAAQRSYSSARDWITIAIPVSQVERLLDTKYSVYEHADGERLVRAHEWSLPRHLHEHIGTIQPTTAFLKASPQLSTVSIADDDLDLASIASLAVPGTGDITVDCNFELVTPTCLRTLYKTIGYTPKALKKNTVGFTNYLGEVPSRDDARQFLATYRPDAVGGENNFREISIANGPLYNGTNAGVEADLDVETILGLTYPMNVTSYSTGGSPPFKASVSTPTNTNEPYLTWLLYILQQRRVPQTISTSYGDDEQTVPRSYATIACQGFAALGARGVTLLFSSGDSGVGADGTCVSNDGKNTTKFLPAFPASCPFVTTVGGTRNSPEIVAFDVVNGYVSGAGFSNYFSRPAYQNAQVTSYLKSVNPALDGLYNKTGRAYPDIAAQGYRYAIIYKGRAVAVDGTSCSAPCTAGVLSLVNDALAAAGKPSLGFLNPLLYKGLGSKAFNDVVGGASTGCGTTGFQAQPGWDVASGFGTPDFKKITAALGVGQ